MKKITLLSALGLSLGLVACGGGDPESASSKPDTLFPDGYVPPVISSSSSSAPSNGAKQAIPFHENFDSATNTRTFFSTAYKALNSDTAKPFYYPAGGFLDEFGNPSPTATSWITADANRKLRIGNGRLTFGQTKLEKDTTTADITVPTWGEFDLSKAYKVSFCVVQVSAASSSNFEIYVDNNTTGGNNSIYGAGNASRILQVATHTLVPGTRHEVSVPKAAGDKQIGSATSFFQWRVSSGGWAVIDDVVVEYAGEPHGFNLPACVAEESIAPPPEAVIAPDEPAAPTFESGNNQLKVSWAVVPRATGYTVAYNTVNSTDGATLINDVTTTSTTITGLTNGTSYYVFIKAINSGGESAFGPSAVGVPEIPATPPASPADLTLYGDDKRALVTWAATDGAESYSVAVNTQNDISTATVIDGITDTYTRLTNLVNNTTYYVFVKAVNVIGSSPYTIAQVVTPSAFDVYQANFAVPLEQFLDSATTAVFAAAPAAQTISADNDQAMALALAGETRLQMTANGFRLANARMTIGMAGVKQDNGSYTVTATTPGTAPIGGTLDLSNNYQICYTVAEKHTAGLFRVYVDNTTTTQANSIHGNASRLINQSIVDIPLNTEQCVDVKDNAHRGLSNSFLMLNADGAGGDVGVVLSSFKVVDLGTTPIKDVTSSSSSVASSSVPASSSSEASSSSSSVAPSSSSEASSSVASSDSSSSSSVDGGGASSSSSSAASSAAALLTEDFSAADTATFLTAAYKSIPTDNSLPLYVATSGSTRMSFANGELSMNNARFTIGDKGGATAAGVQPNGSYDLTRPYRIKFTITAVAGTGNIQVYVDNNTTSQGSSIHGNPSRLLQIAAASVTPLPYNVVIDSTVGTANSFFQIRADSSVTNVTIDNLTIEYQ